MLDLHWGKFRMTKSRFLAGTAAAALILSATAASAQIDPRPELSPVQAGVGLGLDREIEDIELRTQREIAAAEDRARFGLGTVPQGVRGSVSLTGFASFGNQQDAFIGAAGRLTIGQGNLSHSFGLAGEYAETDEDAGSARIIGIYDGNLNFDEQFYAFGLVRGEYRDEDEVATQWDVFAGVGPGIRLINTPTTAWRVQAGPGVRFTRIAGESETELAGILSSRASFQVANDVFVTNDTDLLYSDADTLISNDLALNTRLAGPLSARVGLRTDWRDTDGTDNRVTLGLVYSFQ
jgi:putative salt-induced outer membrane protein